MISLDFTGPNSVWVGTDGAGVAHFDGSAWAVHSSANSGLISDRVGALSMDADGRKFAGTARGLVELSGDSWSGFQLANSGLQPTSRTTDIAIDAQGTAWIGTGEDFAEDGYGLVKYDGSTWSVLNTSNSDLPNNTVTSVAVGSDGKIWAGTVDGLGIFDGSTWEVIAGYGSPLPEDEIKDITTISGGAAWVAASGFDGGLVHYDGSEWTTYTPDNANLPTEDITSVAVDCTGTVWAGTRYEGVVKFDGSTWSSGNAGNTVLQSSLVSDIAVDAENNLWVTREYSNDIRGGVMKYDGSSWTNFLAGNSAFPGDAQNATSVTIDAAGNVWVGSEGAGLVQYDGSRMQVYRPENSGISTGTVFGVAIDAAGNKWITGNSGGVDVLEGAAEPVADFAAVTREGPAPLTVRFRNKSQNGADSYNWQFAGGTPSASTEVNPAVTFESEGTYEVTLEVTNAYGQDTETRSGYIAVHGGDYAPPSAWQVYNNGDVVQEIVEDGDELWIATNGGLVTMHRFSGNTTIYNTSNSPLRANNILDIDMDSNGTLWMATNGGGLTSMKDGNWTVYTADDGNFSYDAISRVEVDSDNNVWFSTFESGAFGSISNGGITRFNGSSFETFSFSESSGGDRLPDGQVNALTFDGSGDLWIGMDSGGLVKFDGADFTVHTSSATDLPSDQIEAIHSAGEETVWIGCGGLSGGLVRYDGSAWEVYTEDNSGMHDDWVQTIAADGQGDLWLGTEAAGMARFDGSGFTFYVRENSGVLSNNVNEIHVDSESTLWVGTKLVSVFSEYSGQPGLVSWDGSRWMPYDLSNSGLPSNATSVAYQDSRGDIWIGAQSAIGFFGDPQRGGLVRYDGAEWELFLQESSGLPLSTVDIIAEDGNGHLWMANPSNDDVGAVRFDGKVWTAFHTENSEMPANTVNDYAVDGNGELWIATTEGLVHFTDSVETTYTTGTSDIPGDEVTAVAVDGSGTLWVGTAASGVSAFDYGSDSWTTYGESDHESLLDRIDEIEVSSATDVYLIASGWIGSELIRYDGSAWESMDTVTGWDIINDLEITSQGKLWVALGAALSSDFSGGIAKYDGSAWTTYSSANSGYPGGSVQSIEATASGDFWLATANGAVWFRGEDAISTGIQAPDVAGTPDSYMLSQNYPNPFNPVTAINYALPKDTRVRLEVFNLLGQQVDVLVDAYQQAGRYTVRWDATNLSSGMYFYRIKTPGFTEVRKMTFLK